jgi:hypothetical protein
MLTEFPTQPIGLSAPSQKSILHTFIFSGDEHSLMGVELHNTLLGTNGHFPPVRQLPGQIRSEARARPTRAKSEDARRWSDDWRCPFHTSTKAANGNSIEQPGSRRSSSAGSATIADRSLRDSIYWETKPGEPTSPAGDMLGQVSKEGYNTSGKQPPYHGY